MNMANANYILQARVGSARLRVGSARFHVGSARVFRHQHVGIGNANHSRWGPYPMGRPNVNGFALQWNIGFTLSGYQS